MTDRHAAYIVVLEKDIREDDAEAIIGALRMVRHVASVEPVVADVSHLIAMGRIRNEIGGRFIDFYKSILGVKDPAHD